MAHPQIVQIGAAPVEPIWICHTCGTTYRCAAPKGRSDGDGDWITGQITCPHCGKGQGISVEHPSSQCKKIIYYVYH